MDAICSIYCKSDFGLVKPSSPMEHWFVIVKTTRKKCKHVYEKALARRIILFASPNKCDNPERIERSSTHKVRQCRRRGTKQTVELYEYTLQINHRLCAKIMKTILIRITTSEREHVKPSHVKLVAVESIGIEPVLSYAARGTMN